jgi:hypothetical protein
MLKVNNGFSRLVFFILLTMTLSKSQAQSLPASPLPDFEIVMESQSGRRVHKQPSERDPLLGIRKTKVRAGDTAEKLLKRNGLFVNANALMLFELLNPSTEHQPLTVKSEVSVPTILDSMALTKARQNGFKIKVVLYPKLKAEINELVDYGLCGAILAQNRDDVPKLRSYLAAEKRSVKKLLNDNVYSSEATLRLIRRSLEGRNGILHAPCGADDTLKIYELEAIDKGLGSIAQSANSTRNSNVTVSVSTVGMNGEIYSNLEVFSRPEWLWHKDRFPNLSSPSNNSLSIGDYVISADGAPYKLECMDSTDVKIRPQTEVFTVTVKCKPRGQ